MRPGQVHTNPRPGQARTCNPLVSFAQNVCSVECFAPGGFKGVAQADTRRGRDAGDQMDQDSECLKSFFLSNDVAD